MPADASPQSTATHERQPTDSRILLFDLDGTLTNPFDGITLSLLHALTALGYTGQTQDSLRHRIGPPLRTTFAELMRPAGAELIERAVALYRERYFATGLYENAVYDGTLAMLRSAHSRGHRMFVVTSKVTAAAEIIVAHFELDQFFERVYGSDPAGALDDKADLIAHVLEREQIDASDCVMIGDREHDVIAARRNQVPSIGVTWGFGSVAELAAAGADMLCDSPAMLPDIVSRCAHW